MNQRAGNSDGRQAMNDDEMPVVDFWTPRLTPLPEGAEAVFKHAENGTTWEVWREGQPIAVILPIDEFECLLAAVEGDQ